MQERLDLVLQGGGGRLCVSVALLYGQPSAAGPGEGTRQGTPSPSALVVFYARGALGPRVRQGRMEPSARWEQPGCEEVPEAGFVRRGNIFYGSNSQRWIKGASFRAPTSFSVSEIGAARDKPGN